MTDKQRDPFDAAPAPEIAPAPTVPVAPAHLALIPCPVCKREIAAIATMCPHCGATYQHPPHARVLRGIGGALAGIALFNTIRLGIFPLGLFVPSGAAMLPIILPFWGGMLMIYMGPRTSADDWKIGRRKKD